MNNKKTYAGAIVLGMHDALVSLTGLIAGLTFTLADKQTIILSALIASLSAALSMGASAYLAEKTNKNQYALRDGITTGMAYIGTCVFLIAPFFVVGPARQALWLSFVVAGLIIISCNLCIRRAHSRPWWKHAMEMLVICASVSIITFIFGELAKKWLS